MSVSVVCTISGGRESGGLKGVVAMGTWAVGLGRSHQGCFHLSLQDIFDGEFNFSRSFEAFMRR